MQSNAIHSCLSNIHLCPTFNTIREQRNKVHLAILVSNGLHIVRQFIHVLIFSSQYVRILIK